MRYNQEEEYRADLVSMQLLADAGYPANAMATLLQKIYASQKTAAPSARPNPYLSSHPLMPERIERDREISASGVLKPQKAASSSIALGYSWKDEIIPILS